MSSEKSSLICLIDASAYLHRAYHALPPLTNSKGQPVNAIYGFTRMLSKILKSEQPNYLGVCFDTPKPTFRHQMFAEYKGSRKETDEALVSQLPMAFDLAHAWGLPCLKMDGFEADDVIATLTHQATNWGWRVLILSGDKDILQLVNTNVMVRDEIKKIDYSPDRVCEKYGLAPNQLLDYFCLMGDKIDNVPGVPGVGEKTAAKLIQQYDNLENLFARINEISGSLKTRLLEHKDRAIGNRMLIRLKNDVPLNIDASSLKVKPADSHRLLALLMELEFKGDLFGDGIGNQFAGLSENKKRRVHIVQSSEDLRRLKQVLASSSVISFDVETDSLEVRQCGIVGLALSVKESEAWYFPISHHYMGMPVQLSWEKIKADISFIFQDSRVLKVAQNLKFDQAVLEHHGLMMKGPFFDTMLAAYCLDANRSNYGLKDLAADYLSEKMVRFEELFGSSKNQNIAELPIEQVASYCGADAEVTFRLYELFNEKLSKEPALEKLFKDIEMPLIEVIRSMETSGVKVDVAALRAAGVQFENEKKIIEKEIFSLAGTEFLINSPKQLAQILFERLKLPSGRKTKTGYSTGEDVLSGLAKSVPIAAKILAYRELAKLISTYVDSLLELMDPSSERIHTSFHQTGTTTGRLSSSNPNLQNIPIRTEYGRKIRRVFVASDNCQLLSADYSQIDLRALAHMSADPVLIETFKKGGDIHAATASEVFHVPIDQVSSEMRRRAKAINFGVVYGQQAWGLSQSLGIELSEAQNFIARYFEKYAGVKKWMEATLDQARRTGFVCTWAGRRRRTQDLNASNSSVRGFAERIAINTPIQGTSADIIKVAMNSVFGRLKSEGWAAKMLLQVHDELVFEVPQMELESFSELVRKEMEQAASLLVPLVVDIKVGQNWNDMTLFRAAVGK